MKIVGSIRRLSATLPALLAVVPLTLAQSAAPTASAATPAKPLSFDVVSIKQNKSDTGGGSGRSTPDGDTNINTLLAYQIAAAYGVEPDDVYGLPDWAKNNRYDIQTKSPRKTFPTIANSTTPNESA